MGPVLLKVLEVVGMLALAVLNETAKSSKGSIRTGDNKYRMWRDQKGNWHVGNPKPFWRF